MIDLINKCVEIQKKLEEEHGIIGVSSRLAMPSVHLYVIDKFIEIATDCKITVADTDDQSLPYKATFIKNNIEFMMFLSEEDFEKAIKIEGVKHE